MATGSTGAPKKRRSIWVYVVVTVGLVAVLVGWAFAAIALNNGAQTAQGQSVQHSGAVPGVVVAGTLYPNIPAAVPAVASTTRTALTALTMGATAAHVDRYCAVACTAGQFSEELEYTITAQAAAEGMQITVVAQSGAHTVSVTNYFHIPATAAGAVEATLALYVDVVASAPLLSVTASIQQCSTATTCP